MRHRCSVLISVCVLLAAGVWGAAAAEDKPVVPSAAENEGCQSSGAGNRKAVEERASRTQSSMTSHHFAVGAQNFDYTATADTLLIRDDDDRPIASIEYIAYTRHDAKGNNQRPIMFAFNGGPGSSSIWLHMGLLGPKRVLVADTAPTPPAPFRTIDNEFSILDKADVVIIDAVGTGLSRAVCGKQDVDFWNTDADIDSFSRFIAQYVSDNDRWTSPKYLLGESYGTTRAAALVDHLRGRRMLTFNGLVLVSVAIDMEIASYRRPGLARWYPLFLPSFAAVAWYHHLVPGQSGPLEPFLQEVRRYAEGPYAEALMKGNALSEDEVSAVAEQVHKYTGLSVDYIKAANLRITAPAFDHELLKSQGKTISVLDGRFTGPTQDPLKMTADYDPLFADIGPAYTAAFSDYLHGDLKFGIGQTYKVYPDADIADRWNYSHKPLGANLPQPMVNSEVDLSQAVVQDPNLKVLVLNGYYDLGSPFLGSEYEISHLQIPRDALRRIQMKYYAAGHLMYVNPTSLRQMKSDLDAFLDSTH
jgi:carboxypeptidase C (cathepsin A)